MAAKQPGARRWKLTDRPVDVSQDHFELRYGSAEESGWNEWLPVARVGPPTGSSFAIEWLVDRTDPVHRKAVHEVAGELDFYLVEKGEPNPWNYARYHCGTGANIYSLVHWSFHRGAPGRGLGARRRSR